MSLKYVHYEIELAKGLEVGLTVVMISDLHLGDVMSERRLSSIVNAINSLNPDIVCITGDIFNDDFRTIQNPQRARDLLLNINSTYGVFACLGNHDGGSTFNEMAAFLDESGVRLLMDEYEIIDGRFVIVGRLDPSPIGGLEGRKRQELADFLPFDTGLPVIVMDHNPMSIGTYGAETDLVLSGHTHRGQVFPGSLITKRIFHIDYGHRLGTGETPHLIVTQGVHTWLMPVRVGTNNEIVSIRIN
jgi:hypothetical protein